MVRPHPIIRLALHAPVEIYEHGFGRLLGKRFVRLSHGGSDTCDCRTVLEVIGANGDEVMVIAGLGPSCEWFRDINSGAPVSVELGGTTFPADHRVLGEPEAVAVISDEILERAREGSIPMLTDMMEYGATILKREHVMEGVADMLTILQVEALFPDGTKLVTVMNPIRD